MEAGEDVVKDAVRGGVDRGDNEEAKAGEGQANVEQGDGAAEEKEEAEAIVAEFVRVSSAFVPRLCSQFFMIGAALHSNVLDAEWVRV